MTAALEVSHLEKSFGGLRATADVSMTVAENELHAVIGPNGAGKTTLICQLFGELAPDKGSIRVGGEDITHLPPHARARARRGLARSFQITALARAGLERRADEPVANLSHGEQRQLELAIALLGTPKLVLLDEPMAGLGPEESRAMTTALRALKGRTTVVLVEHDMEAVFGLADRITVLVRGAVIAVGTPDEIRSHPAVRDAYLGEDD